jgi:hypothetical protein
VENGGFLQSELSSEECASPTFCAKSEPSLLTPSKQAVVVAAPAAAQNKYVALYEPTSKPKKKSFMSLKNLLTFRKTRCVSTRDSKLQADSLKGLIQQIGRMPGYIELVVYCLRETAV